MVLRSSRVEGRYHEALKATLAEALKSGRCTQDSLALAIGKRDNSSLSKYFNDKGSGPLDLDEAAAGLDHIGSNLVDFIAGVPTPKATATDRLVRRLRSRPALFPYVLALLAVPRPRLAAVFQLVESAVISATGRTVGQIAESHAERTQEASTKSARAKRQ